MARYILVEVDDNATANRLRAQIDKAGEAKGMRVVGMFRKATQMCECPIRSEKSVLGSRFMWWLCPQCLKPKSGSHQTLRNMLDWDRLPRGIRHYTIMLSVRWVWDKTTERVATYVHPED